MGILSLRCMPEAGSLHACLLRKTLLVGAAWVGMVFPTGASAGAWIREPGHFFAKVGANFSSAYDPVNEPVGLEQQVMAFSLFAEVGLPYRMDLVVDVPYVVATNGFRSEARYDNHSFGDAHIQLDRGLFSRLQLTAALDLKVPMYRTLSATATTGLVEINHKIYPSSSFPEVGNGTVELTPKLLYGKSFNPRPLWFTAELGARLRFGGLAQGLYASAGSGAWVWPEHLALALYGSVAYNFSSRASALRPSGEDAQYAVYFGGSVIVSGAPWLPWLKIFGSAGTLLLESKSKTGTDFGVGVAVEY